MKLPGEESAILEITVESGIGTSQGARAIRSKLVELHEKLFGMTVTVDSPEVETAFQLFVEVWERKRRSHDWREGNIECGIRDYRFFDGVNDDVLQLHTTDNGYQYYVFDWERVEQVLGDVEWWGQNHIVRTWVVMLTYFLTDYRYLFL